MEWLQSLVMSLVDKYPIVSTILMVLGSLVVLAQIIVPLTPTKKDDKILEDIKGKPWLKSLLDFFVSFAVFQKKDGEIKLSKD